MSTAIHCAGRVSSSISRAWTSRSRCRVTSRCTSSSASARIASGTSGNSCCPRSRSPAQRLPVFFRHVKARAQVQEVHLFDLIADPHRVHEAVRILGLTLYLPGPDFPDAHDARYTGHQSVGFLHSTLYIPTNGSYAKNCPSGAGKRNCIPEFSRIGTRLVQVGLGLSPEVQLRSARIRPVELCNYG